MAVQDFKKSVRAFLVAFFCSIFCRCRLLPARILQICHEPFPYVAYRRNGMGRSACLLCHSHYIVCSSELGLRFNERCVEMSVCLNVVLLAQF